MAGWGEVGIRTELGGQWEEMVGIGFSLPFSFCMPFFFQKFKTQQPTDNWNGILRDDVLGFG